LSGASEALIKWMSEALLRNPNFTVKFNTSAEDIIYTKSSIFGFRVGGIVAKNMNTV
jgi:ribosomal protein L14